MQAFSSTVRDLYALAEYASPDQFLGRAIELIQSCIRFDGAIFGTGEKAMKAALARAQPEALNGATAESDLASAIRLEADDPVTRGFREAPMAPTRGGIRELYRKRRDGKRPAPPHLSGVRSLADELGLCHLIVCGDDPRKVQPARWILLYRQQDVRFAATDAANLHGLWEHFSKAMTINRARAATRLSASSLPNQDNGSATGLITNDGQIEIADQRFYDLLEREWPELAPDFIPVQAMELLNDGKPYRGAQVEISVVRQAVGNLCRIRPVKATEALTPREFIVARRFAAGMSHKQIARELGVSHHTVRNQLAHLYRKLGLHDKASLAQYFAANVAANVPPQ